MSDDDRVTHQQSHDKLYEIPTPVLSEWEVTALSARCNRTLTSRESSQSFTPMDITKYMVDEASIQTLTKYQIAKFFEKNGPISQQNCHDTAARIVGGSIAPTPVQGMTSYTVTAGDTKRKALQFRAPDAALDMKIMARARDTYKNFVPSCEERGLLGSLLVYEMDVVEGVAFSIAQRAVCGIENYKLLERAVQDLAKYVQLSQILH